MTAARSLHKRMIRDRRLAEIEDHLARTRRLIDAPGTSDELRTALAAYAENLTAERALLSARR